MRDGNSIVEGELIWSDGPFLGKPIFVPVDSIEFKESQAGFKKGGRYVIKNRSDGESLYPVKK